MAASGPNALSFPKSARLLRRPQFLAVKEQGRGFAEGPLAASWVARRAGGLPDEAVPALPARVGIAVSSKVGKAVVRNLVKRRLREAIRHELAGLPSVDLVLVARASSTRATVPELRAWLRRASARIRSGPRRP